MKKNKCTALSKALGPFLYGFISSPCASNSTSEWCWYPDLSSKRLDRALGRFKESECSAWEQAELEMSRRENAVRAELEQVILTILSCKPTTVRPLDSIEQMNSERLRSHIHKVNVTHFGKPIRFSRTYSATMSAKAKSKAPALPDQGIFIVGY